MSGPAADTSAHRAGAGALARVREALQSLGRRLEVSPADYRAAQPLLYGVAALFIILVALIPLIGTTSQRLLIQQALYLGLLALSLRLLVSTTGLVSFGHAMFLAVGAYFVGITFVHFGWAPLLTLGMAPFVGGVVAFIVGLIVLRGKELYFALLTLGVAQLFWAVAHSWRSVTGGGDGTTGVFAAEWLNPFANTENLYWFVLGCVAVCTVILYVITESPFGDALRGIRENRSRAEFSGLWVWRHEVAAFVIAGMFGTVAGALQVIGETQISSGQVTWEASAIALVAILLGGTRYFLGPFAGALFYFFLVDYLIDRTNLWQMVLGAIILLVALAPVGGLSGVIHWLLAQVAVLGRRLGIGSLAPEGEMSAEPQSGSEGASAPPSGNPGETPGMRSEERGESGRPTLLEIRNARKAYGGLVAVDDASLSVTEGDIHAIIGPNGAGKTTLFHVVTGLVPPDAGDIFLAGERINGQPAWRLARKGLARSFQQPNLFWELDVLTNVMIPKSEASGGSLKMYGRHPEDVYRRAGELLDQVGLRSLASVPVAALSHGDRRTLEIAMTLALEPRLLLLDEPTAGLSPYETRDAVSLIRQIARDRDLTVLFVEHDMDVVFGIADRVAVLVEGSVIAEGTPSEIRDNQEVQKAYLGDNTSLSSGE